MCDFIAPELHVHTGWGPPPISEAEPLGSLGICDFVEHLEKFGPTYNRIGKACDFSASGQRYAQERGMKGKGKDGKGKDGKGKGKPFVTPTAKDDDGFELVDNSAIPGNKGRGKSYGGRSKGRGKFQANYQEGILGQKQKMPPAYQQQQKGKSKGKGGPQRRQAPSFKEWSVQTKSEWPVKREIMLSALAKLQLDSKEVTHEDICWCGRLNTYNRAFDRITTKTERQMKRFEDVQFFSVTTSDDPILTENFQEDPSISVIATDHILACIIAAARSVYSWDIVVTKLQNKLIFDKRDSSVVDFLTVNETANEPPNNDDQNHMNSPVKLGQEASCINQNFSQMVLDTKLQDEKMDQPNPFDEEGAGNCASGAYRYKKITLPGNNKSDNEFEASPVSMLVRTEINCKGDENDDYISVKALNEFDIKASNSWRMTLESQRGAILANEVKNNAFKLGRWTAQAMLADCKTMKVGYVSRQQPNDPWNHTVLGVQTHRTTNFAAQIGLTQDNLFGILRAIIDMVMDWPDGKYLLLKDPTKAIMRMYEIPWEAFQDDDEDGEEESEDDRQLDEDGNAVPQQMP